MELVHRSFASLGYNSGSGQLGLGQLGELGEGGLVIDGQLGEHLPVDLHIGQLQAVHEGGIVHAVGLAGGADTGDPELTEVALLHPAAGIGVGAGLHDGLFGHLEVLGFGSPVALCRFVIFKCHNPPS